ncbi:hypothetical protein [Methylobacterium oxalidis]|uniref:Uncharacterized protein n=1 Tax=Methylobacterium oxalidis TaxID=944322 RepID=A0ABQ6DSC6_9HYPH|nr:hypothetical protein GCM10007888_54540 [Methylobacterium oxalidis]
MATPGSLGPEGDQTAECGVWDRSTAAVEEPPIETHLGEEGIGIGIEVDEDSVDLLRDPAMDEADRRGCLGQARLFSWSRRL